MTLPVHLTSHFSADEVTHSDIAARLGISNLLPSELEPVVQTVAVRMEQVRNALNYFPIHIDSWYRSFALNRALRSLDTSQHLLGEAVDFICPQFGSPTEIVRKIAFNGLRFDQLILEHTWVHISFAVQPIRQPRGEVLTLLLSGGYARGITDMNGVPT